MAFNISTLLHNTLSQGYRTWDNYGVVPKSLQYDLVVDRRGNPIGVRRVDAYGKEHPAIYHIQGFQVERGVSADAIETRVSYLNNNLWASAEENKTVVTRLGVVFKEVKCHDGTPCLKMQVYHDELAPQALGQPIATVMRAPTILA